MLKYLASPGWKRRATMLQLAFQRTWRTNVSAPWKRRKLEVYAIPSGLGDEVMAAGVAQAASRANPGLRLIFHTRHPELFQGMAGFSDVQRMVPGTTPKSALGLTYAARQDAPVMAQMAQYLGMPLPDFRIDLPRRPASEVPAECHHPGPSSPSRPRPATGRRTNSGRRPTGGLCWRACPPPAPFWNWEPAASSPPRPPIPATGSCWGEPLSHSTPPPFRQPRVHRPCLGGNAPRPRLRGAVIHRHRRIRVASPLPSFEAVLPGGACAPCWLRDACSYGRKCLQEIHPRDVLAATLQHLEQPPQA